MYLNIHNKIIKESETVLLIIFLKLKINHIHTTGLVCGGPSGVPQLRHEKHKPECGNGPRQVWVGALGLLRGRNSEKYSPPHTYISPYIVH